ncbi:hypothetical protein ABIA30_004061 [Mycobacterium sp. MAA66]|uniref:hypothetical protein n=1 Tax=Mycobacterium sp. MAA66 TaxID=3156297 RepID=UPI00351379ED
MPNTRWLYPVTAALVLVASPGCASAEPPAGGVPDINGFTDVTANFTTPTGHGSPGFSFATPDGVTCGGSSQQASCDGPLPGLSGIPLSHRTTGPCDGGSAIVSVGGTQIVHANGACPAPGGAPVLGVGQKVMQGAITCGVADGGITVCTNGPHGFVLQPSGSSTF